jgi:glycosyltransferase involved in cell wall biosynthesis
MACFLPIISTSAAGEIRARVEHGLNGYIVPPESSSGLAECMMRFVDKPEMCKKMGMASSKKIEGHTPEKWAKDFEKIIDKMIGK